MVKRSATHGKLVEWFFDPEGIVDSDCLRFMTNGVLLNALANETGIVPVVRRVEAKFKKPANGRGTSTVNASLTALDESLAELAAKGRCLLTVHVDVFDEKG